MAYNIELLVSVTTGTDCKTLCFPALGNESDFYLVQSTETEP